MDHPATPATAAAATPLHRRCRCRCPLQSVPLVMQIAGRDMCTPECIEFMEASGLRHQQIQVGWGGWVEW